MNYEIELDGASQVNIGDSFQAQNRIVLTVKGTGAYDGVAVALTVEVGCGAGASDLLASKNNRVKATCSYGDVEDEELVLAVTADQGKKSWESGMFSAITLPATIRLEDFVSNTPAGQATISLTIRDDDGERPLVKSVPKSLDQAQAPAIRYFLVDPNYVLYAGQTVVTVSFLATGVDRVSLFRNNEEVKSWERRDGVITDRFKDKPSITSVYQLKGYFDSGQQEPVSAPDRIVQVMSSGWNRLSLPIGSPIRLFVAEDFRGSGLARLYGIFRDADGNYSLYSSSTGLDGWVQEGDIPTEAKHMAMSPGVVYNGKLWLIGGSSVDPENCSNDVWSYDKNGWSNRSGEQQAPWSKRMGHACVVFPKQTRQGGIENEIWLIGGVEGVHAYNDIWRCTEDNGALCWENISKQCPWQGRMNHAATVVRNSSGESMLWLYGGSEDPWITLNLYDMWSTLDGMKWKLHKLEPDDSYKLGPGESAIVPDPGRPLGCALVIFRSNASLPDRLFLLGSFQEWADAHTPGSDLGNRISSFMFEWQWGKLAWEVQPIIEGWQQFHGDNFYMQAIAFNRCVFVWSLPSDIEGELEMNGNAILKLNIFIPL
jgi:hypothetical protein